MKNKDRKRIVENKYKKRIIPEDLIDEINNDIETYLKEKSQENQKIIREIISFRLSNKMDVFFSEDYIIEKLNSIYK